MEERLKKRLLKFGRKNRICRFLVMPAGAVCGGFFYVVFYVRGNGKRLSMLAMSLILFTVYSSFSFPLFISTDKGKSGDLLDPELLTEPVTLAKETQVDLESMEWLEDADVMGGNLLEGFVYSEASSYGGGIVDKYDAEEILQYNQERSDHGEEPEEDMRQEGDEVTFSKDDWRLILVNKQHSIPQDYTFPLAVIQSNTKKQKMQCDERILDDLLAMMQAAKEDGITLSICSSYRDMAYQEFLLDRKITDYMRRGMSYMEAFKLSSQAVTVPEASEHQIGLALDIVCDSYDRLEEGFADTDAGKWLAENSYRFGFILRYPKGKEHITCIEYEPWHFRYVGVDAATVITERGITLEEFLEEL